VLVLLWYYGDIRTIISSVSTIHLLSDGRMDYGGDDDAEGVPV